MKLSEVTNLGELIENIAYLSTETDENKEMIQNIIASLYGDRECVNAMVKNFTLTGALINTWYAKGWERLKDALSQDVPIYKGSDTETEERTTSIYGYDGNGTTDNVVTTTHTAENEKDDPYIYMNKGIDFFRNNSYYMIIARDIVSTITEKVY